MKALSALFETISVGLFWDVGKSLSDSWPQRCGEMTNPEGGEEAIALGFGEGAIRFGQVDSGDCAAAVIRAGVLLRLAPCGPASRRTFPAIASARSQREEKVESRFFSA